MDYALHQATLGHPLPWVVVNSISIATQVVREEEVAERHFRLEYRWGLELAGERNCQLVMVGSRKDIYHVRQAGQCGCRRIIILCCQHSLNHCSDSVCRSHLLVS